MLPWSLLGDPELKPLEKIHLAHLWNLSGMHSKKWLRVKYAEWAKWLAVDRKTVERVFRGLERKGFIQYKGHNKGADVMLRPRSQSDRNLADNPSFLKGQTAPSHRGSNNVNKSEEDPDGYIQIVELEWNEPGKSRHETVYKDTPDGIQPVTVMYIAREKFTTGQDVINQNQKMVSEVRAASRRQRECDSAQCEYLSEAVA
jgi:hypothetical protein